MELHVYNQFCKKVNIVAEKATNWLEKSKEQKSLDQLRKILTRLSQDKILLGILGRQGVGKSTFGNVLIGKPVFPMDVKETTSLYTYVSGIDEDQEEYALISFENGHQEKGPLNDSFLHKFVDQNINLDNKLRVKDVHCFTHVDWLFKHQITLVDTPGVNSINQCLLHN